jgi:DAACS family dicarboxylate/amino acid:cation (Na+ or H+) symporter
MESSSNKQPLWKIWTWKLHWQILVGLVVGILIGYFMAQLAINNQVGLKPREYLENNPFRLLFKTGGEMFLNALKLVVIPLVTSSIILAIASIAARKGFARLGMKTLTYFLTTSTIAILIGLFLVNWIKPGVIDPNKPLLDAGRVSEIQANFSAETKRLADSAKMDQEKSGETLVAKVLGVLKSLVPANPVKAAADMDLLGLITIALFFGYFMSRLNGATQSTMENFWQGVNDISMMFTEFILKMAPIGVAMLLAHTIMDNYVTLAAEERVGDLIEALKWFAITALAGLLFHLFIVLPGILFLFTGIGPIKLFKALLPSLLTAFSTASSNATISVTMDCCENRAGVSNETAAFVVPLGATVNMNGTALYECVAAMFIVQLFGYQLDVSVQFMVVLIALLTSVGVAGVPSASLVAIIIILNSVSKQLGNGVDLSGGLAILLILDRPLDMVRTAVNVFGDATGAVLIAKTEGEKPFSVSGKVAET